MLTILKELYKLYEIYIKLNNVLKHRDIVTDSYCQEIKAMILNDGCIAIKFAQWIISRLRSEPGEHIQYIVNYFDDIFDNCPFHPIEYTYKLFTEYSKHNSLDNILVSETLKEIASGSVGQVYRAKLKYPYIVCPECDNLIRHYEYFINNTITNDDKNVWCATITKSSGQNDAIGSMLSNVCSAAHKHICLNCNIQGREIYDIAIKIKHPDVNKQVLNKVKLFRFLSLAQNIKWVKNMLNLHMDMNDFINNLTNQIDFRNEYENNRKFRKNFKANSLILFPLALESGKDILISEYIETQSFDSIPEYNQYKQCLNYACMVSQMVLIDNFVHADLHHKNWQIKKVDDVNYKLVVFDTGICFNSDDLTINRIIWESFESGDVDQIMNIMDKIVIGTYTNNIQIRIKSVLEYYRHTSLNIGHIMNEINTILCQYNCKMSTLCLNIILLICLIDTTLKKHNLIGNSDQLPMISDNNQSPTRKHQNILRSKNLDLIAYLRSNPGCYPDVLVYFEDKQKRLFADNNNGLFGNCANSCLVFDVPPD